MLVERDCDNGITVSDLHNIQQCFCRDMFADMPEFISNLEHTGHQVRVKIDSENKVVAVFFMHRHAEVQITRKKHRESLCAYMPHDIYS